MRDPIGNEESYKQYFHRQQLISEFPLDGLELFLQVKNRAYRFTEKQEVVLHQYAYGAPLGEVAESVRQCMQRIADDNDFVQQHKHDVSGQGEFPYPLPGSSRSSTSFVNLAVSLLPDAAAMTLLAQLAFDENRTYFLDLMLKAFVPGFVMAKKYKADKYQAVWIDPVLRALALPADQRGAALASHMGKWCRLMTPWGWKPNLDPSPGKDNLFWNFAHEVALAVCAYDIDDSSFNTHPYYPRDLVEHYRANIRRQRDAWRPDFIGAAVPVLAPAPAPKADLAKSKRKGLARWIELVSDGDADVTDAVIEVVGKPRKVTDGDELLSALSENGQAILADIKDDDTVAITAGRLAEARGLGEFDVPPGPPYGPARCVAILRAFGQWLGERGYRLVAVDTDGDAWCAVVVKQNFYAELQTLGGALGIPEADPAAHFRV